MRTPRPIQDRRRAARFGLEVPFRIAQEGFDAEAITTNISNNGLYFKTNLDIAMMTKLDIRLCLPEPDRAIRVKAVVVRKEKDPMTHDFYVAAYISDIRPADQKALDKFIQSRAPQS